jgi:hypothetical protein
MVALVKTSPMFEWKAGHPIKEEALDSKAEIQHTKNMY